MDRCNIKKVCRQESCFENFHKTIIHKDVIGRKNMLAIKVSMFSYSSIIFIPANFIKFRAFVEVDAPFLIL